MRVSISIFRLSTSHFKEANKKVKLIQQSEILLKDLETIRAYTESTDTVPLNNT